MTKESQDTLQAVANTEANEKQDSVEIKETVAPAVQETTSVKETVVETVEKVVEEVVITDGVETPVEEDFGEMLEKTFTAPELYRKGDVAQGTVVAINGNSIFIGLGGKQDGVADVEEYKDANGNLTYAIGDAIKGFVVKINDVQLIISKSLNAAHANRQALREAFESKMPVKGKVSAAVKGGFSVNVFGARTFCPISQISDTFVKDTEEFIGKSYDFEIIEYKENGKNVILSRRVLLQRESKIIRDAALAKIEVGTVVTGKVSRLTNFGAFIDLGGVDGLLHVSEMAWHRIEKPSEAVKIGEEIEVKIIKKSGEKISLSVKVLHQNPLDAALAEIHEGDIVNARILRNENFGSFVEIQPGVEGLIPISQMVRGRRINKPSEVVDIGDIVEAQIIKVDTEARQISLSLKSLQPDPWVEIDDHIHVGDITIGIIENLADFGTFIRLFDGVTGLLPLSKMQIANISYGVADIGTEVEIKVAEIDKDRQRVSLEPVNMPEVPQRNYNDDRNSDRRGGYRGGRKDDSEWKRYSNQNRNEVPEDNPFKDL